RRTRPAVRARRSRTTARSAACSKPFAQQFRGRARALPFFALKLLSTTPHRAFNLRPAMQVMNVWRGAAWLAAVGACGLVMAITGVHIDRAAAAAHRDDDPVYLP